MDIPIPAQGSMMTVDGGIINHIRSRDKITLDNIALNISRIPRFCGATKQFWTVMHHSVVCYMIAQHHDYGICEQATMLAHDFHEAFTGDVPSNYKNNQFREIQESLDNQIFSDLGIPRVQSDVIKKIDLAALAAEGSVVGPEGFTEYFFPTYDVPLEHINIVNTVKYLITEDCAVNPDSREYFKKTCKRVFEQARESVEHTVEV